MRDPRLVRAHALLGGNENQGDVAKLLREVMDEPEVVQVVPAEVETVLHCAANTVAKVEAAVEQ